jgi:hypothetical protein
MMITVSELEVIIAQTLPGEQVQYETKPIGSVDHVTRMQTELKLSRSGDPEYLIFVGIDRLVVSAFWRPTIGNPLEFRAGLLPNGMSHQPGSHLFAGGPRLQDRRWCVFAEGCLTADRAANKSRRPAA